MMQDLSVDIKMWGGKALLTLSIVVRLLYNALMEKKDMSILFLFSLEKDSISCDFSLYVTEIDRLKNYGETESMSLRSSVPRYW